MTIRGSFDYGRETAVNHQLIDRSARLAGLLGPHSLTRKR
jgi:hypothetical protein